MGTVSDVTDDTFEAEVLQADGVVLVDFWAPWCRPCHQVAPVLEELASEYGERLRVRKVDIDQNEQSAVAYGITSIPTIVIFSEGKVVGSLVGPRPKVAIEAAIAEHVAA